MYKEVENMKPDEFTVWFNKLSMVQICAYYSYLYKVVAENGIDKIECVNSNDEWEDLNMKTSSAITRYHCRVKTEPKELSYNERQAQWISDNNIKIGTMVKVVRGLDETESTDFHYGWINNMDKMINNIYPIGSIDDDYISVNGWSFPYYVLQPIELKYRPYEKADPKWLGKAVCHEVSGNFLLINGTSFNQVRLSSSWYYLSEMFNWFTWYNAETEEKTPFGEAYYE